MWIWFPDSLLTGVHWSYKVEKIFAARGQIFAAGGKYLTQRDKYLTQGWKNICCKGTSWTINWSLFHLAQTNSHLGFDDGEEEFESSQILWKIPKSCGRTNLHVGENSSDHLDEIPHQTFVFCSIFVQFQFFSALFLSHQSWISSVGGWVNIVEKMFETLDRQLLNRERCFAHESFPLLAPVSTVCNPLHWSWICLSQFFFHSGSALPSKSSVLDQIPL